MIESESKFTYASLFSGIGGFEFGLNAVGGKCVFASEIDKFAVQSYTAIHGDEPHGDISKIDIKDIPDHDILVGGFPCQAFSVAGNQLGFEDSRGTLFFEVARVLKGKQPKIVLLENVKGLVSHDKGKTLDTIVKVLNDVGYRVDFKVLNSKDFGVPQNRERIFIVGIREDLIENDPWVIEGTTVVPKGKRRIGGYKEEDAWNLKTFNFNFPVGDGNTILLREVLEKEVDERFYLDNDKTESLIHSLHEKGLNIKEATKSGKKLAKEGDSVNISYPNSETRRGRVGNKIANTLEASGINQGVIEKVGNVSNTNHGSMDVHSVGGISPTTTARDYKGAKLILEECRPVLTPDRLTKRQNGRRFKEDGEDSSTLTTQDRHGVAIGRYPNYRIRKLTPKECWRLQGFPDEAFFKAKDAGVSDSQLYRQSGNAVTTNVIKALGEKLKKYLK